MLNELFDKLPEYVAFKILTYKPHPDAELIKEFWRIHYLWERLHNIGMFRIRQDIDRIYADMNDWNEQEGEEDDVTFYFHYMYTESPQAWDNNDNDYEWFTQ